MSPSSSRPRPPIPADLYDWFSTLPEPVNTARLRPRAFMSGEWESQANHYWKRAEFPREYLVGKMKELDLLHGADTPERAGMATVMDVGRAITGYSAFV